MKSIQAFGDITVTLGTKVLQVADDATEAEIITLCTAALKEELDLLKSTYDSDTRGFTHVVYFDA